MGEQRSYTSIRPVLSRVLINAQPKADKASSTKAISVSFCAVRQDALYGGMHKGRAETFARTLGVQAIHVSLSHTADYGAASVVIVG